MAQQRLTGWAVSSSALKEARLATEAESRQGEGGVQQLYKHIQPGQQHWKMKNIKWLMQDDEAVEINEADFYDDVPDHSEGGLQARCSLDASSVAAIL
eukprot:2006291-Amphidinium_carterae.1